jgi:hypothetical protein
MPQSGGLLSTPCAGVRDSFRRHAPWRRSRRAFKLLAQKDNLFFLHSPTPGLGQTTIVIADQKIHRFSMFFWHG